MIENLNETKKRLADLLLGLGIYYDVREFSGEALKRYLLDHYSIFLHITHRPPYPGQPEDIYNREGWHYDVVVIEKKGSDNCVSQDFQVYETYDDVLYNGLVEAFAFVSLHREK